MQLSLLMQTVKIIARTNSHVVNHRGRRQTSNKKSSGRLNNGQRPDVGMSHEDLSKNKPASEGRNHQNGTGDVSTPKQDRYRQRTEKWSFNDASQPAVKV